MAATDAAVAADPLFHLGVGDHVGRIEVRYFYFRPEFKYFTCRACSQDGDPSVIAAEAAGCRHRTAPGR
jgi:hypothetical protein